MSILLSDLCLAIPLDFKLLSQRPARVHRYFKMFSHDNMAPNFKKWTGEGIRVKLGGH